MGQPSLTVDVDARGRATVTLARPERHNAFDDAIVAELTGAFCALEADARVRVVVLAAAGRSFSAGADLAWMRRQAAATPADNLRDAEALAALMRGLHGLSRPTIALVQGPAYGGGVGLVACCDVAIATPRASFCLSEARLGLAPAVISPYVVAAMGSRAARRFALTAEPFGAEEARRAGLVHEVVDEGALARAGERIVEAVLKCGPRAVTAVKALVGRVAGAPIDGPLVAETAALIASLRASDEGREGIASFLEKRPPAWAKG